MDMKGKKEKNLLIILIAGYFIIIPVFVLSLHNLKIKQSREMLSLFQGLTENKIYYEERRGEIFQFPENVKKYSARIASESDANAYYGLKAKGYKDAYDIYSEHSQYASDIQQTINDARNLINLFKGSSLLEAIRSQGKKPAIMFDIDNTLEFSSRSDSDLTGQGPPIKPVVEFVRDCLKDGIECYFITARLRSDSKEFSSTKIWLKDTFGLSDLQLKRYVYLVGDLSYGKYRNIYPETQKNVTIAYKDVLRRVLSERDSVFWIMSIGDQLTDVYGKDSGVKVLIPNLFFDNAIVTNPYYEKRYERMQVKELPSEYYPEIKKVMLDITSVN